MELMPVQWYIYFLINEKLKFERLELEHQKTYNSKLEMAYFHWFYRSLIFGGQRPLGSSLLKKGP